MTTKRPPEPSRRPICRVSSQPFSALDGARKGQWHEGAVNQSLLATGTLDPLLQIHNAAASGGAGRPRATGRRAPF